MENGTIAKRVLVGMLLTGFVSAWGLISGSKHDLTGTAWTGDDTEDNGQLCVYCHTPHASNSSFAGAPIWNKTASAANNSFTLYGASSVGTNGVTIAGTATGGAGGTVNPPSMACLSCHDGVSAVNSVVNAPGSGLKTGDADQFIGTGAQTLSTIAANFDATGIGSGSDLSNDHPVSVEYKGDGTATSPASLKAPGTALTGWAGATTIQDVLRTTGGVDYVECGSCHDPHDGATTGGAASVSFLRVANTNSNLCLGCHAK